jgi:hypothetical protein
MDDKRAEVAVTDIQGILPDFLSMRIFPIPEHYAPYAGSV